MTTETTPERATTETDALERELSDSPLNIETAVEHLLDFARRLERQRDELLEALEGSKSEVVKAHGILLQFHRAWVLAESETAAGVEAGRIGHQNLVYLCEIARAAIAKATSPRES